MEFGIGEATTDIPPSILQALGDITVRFGLLDLSLAELFSELVGGDVAIGRAIYAATLSMRTRIDLISAMVKIRAPLYPKDDLRELTNRIDEASGRRDAAVHSVFIGSQPPGQATRLKEKTGRGMGYHFRVGPAEAKELEADAKFIGEVAADVTRATGEIKGLVGKLPTQLPRSTD